MKKRGSFHSNFLKLSLAVLSLSICFSNLSGQNTVSEKVYPINQFTFGYGKSNPDLPPLSAMESIELTVGVKGNIYVDPQQDGQTTTIILGDLPPKTQFSLNGLKYVLDNVVRYWNSKDYYGVYAHFDPSQIDPKTSQDKRPAQDKSLRLITWFSQINEIRTIARGDRIKSSVISNPKHNHLLTHTPLSAKDETIQGSVLKRKILEDYLRRLNRHPGRQIDAAISSSEERGEVILDFIVNENKPYILYAQVSNTGTKSTGDWRERVGFIHHQLTNNDDILSLDYITAQFEEANAVLGSYQIPVISPDYLKLRVYGSWSEFDADEVGISDTDFKGETWGAGAEAIISPITIGKYYFDVIGGVRWANIEVTNETVNQEGNADTLIPYIGIAVGNQSYIDSSSISLVFEKNVNDIDDTDLLDLGRVETDDDWSILKLDSHYNFYLEPKLFPNAWKNRETWLSSTLAHEISMRARGQYTLDDDRVIPQEQFIAGGFSSVRGYPESAASGDSGFTASGEYRFHFPRTFKPYSEMKRDDEAPRRTFDKYDFRPPSIYARPDWDFIVRAFVDYGYTSTNDKRPEDNDLSLLSVGTGIELQLLTHLNLRLDWGYILDGIKRNNIQVEDAEQGDSRFHFISTLSW